jgi:hypothetical protein
VIRKIAKKVHITAVFFFFLVEFIGKKQIKNPVKLEFTIFPTKMVGHQNSTNNLDGLNNENGCENVNFTIPQKPNKQMAAEEGDGQSEVTAKTPEICLHEFLTIFWSFKGP